MINIYRHTCYTTLHTCFKDALDAVDPTEILKILILSRYPFHSCSEITGLAPAPAQ